MAGKSGGSLTWRLVVTIVSTVIWLVFMLYWIGFAATDFEAAQNIVVLCISSVIFTGLNALVWTIWPGVKDK